MDKVNRERVLYTLEALEKVTEPGGFATVSGTLIREIAEIIREREGGILIVSDEVRAPKNCGECFAVSYFGCAFDKEDRFLPMYEGKPHWCPLKEGFLKE